MHFPGLENFLIVVCEIGTDLQIGKVDGGIAIAHAIAPDSDAEIRPCGYVALFERDTLIIILRVEGLTCRCRVVVHQHLHLGGGGSGRFARTHMEMLGGLDLQNVQMS